MKRGSVGYSVRLIQEFEVLRNAVVITENPPQFFLALYLNCVGNGTEVLEDAVAVL